MRSRTTLLCALLLPFFLKAQADTASIMVLNADQAMPVSFARMKALPVHQARIIDHEGEEATYTGAWLSDVLKLNERIRSIEKRAQVNSYVRATAADGYTALIALPECDSAFRERPALLAWMKNTQPLNAHDGPFQIIVPDDRKHARDVRQVIRLEVITP